LSGRVVVTVVGRRRGKRTVAIVSGVEITSVVSGGGHGWLDWGLWVIRVRCRKTVDGVVVESMMSRE
jgi:hypothetical protein